MSKKYLKNIFGILTECKAWSLQIIRVKNSKRNGISYICREVELEPAEELLDFIKATQEFCCSEKGIERFSSVDGYTGNAHFYAEAHFGSVK